RGSFVAVAPVAGDIGRELGADAAAVGLLSGAPLLCFAAFAPFATFLVGRIGANLAITITIAGVALGTIVRVAGGFEAALAGTLLMGAFVAIGNVCIAVILRRDVPPHLVERMSGISSLSNVLGSALIA